MNLEDKNVVLKIDSQKLTVKGRWSVAPGTAPTSMAIDVANDRLFIGCRNKLMVVVNAENGRLVTSLPIGERVYSSAYDPKTKLVFQANGEGTVTVIHQDSEDSYKVIQTLQTQSGSRNMALDDKTHNIYLSAGEFEAPDAPTAENPHPRRKIKPGTFTVFEFTQ